MTTTVQVLQKLQNETGAEVYFTGGYVRDYLRNKENNDLDIVIRGLSRKNIKGFLKRYGTIKEVQLSKTNDLCTVNIILFKAFGDVLEAQITLPRRGKLQIEAPNNTLKQDVRYRDFRLNCLYLPIDWKNKNDVIDIVGGKEDITRRMIVANGSASERIKESPIRMMRAFSLAARTGYNIHKNLLKAIKENALLILKCPAENIRAEFEEILLSKKPSRYLIMLHDCGLLKHIAPEVDNCFGVSQDDRYHKFDVFSHLIYTVDNAEKDLVIRLAGLLHDTGKTICKKEHADKTDGSIRITFHKHEVVSTKLAKVFLNRLKYSGDITNKVLDLVSNHMYHYTRDWTNIAVVRFIKRVKLTEEYFTKENISNFPLFKLRAAERLGSGKKGQAVTERQLDFEQRILQVVSESNGLTINDLNINGNTIMEIFRLLPGVQIGNILRFLLDQVIENPALNNKLDLLKLTTEYIHTEANKVAQI